MDKIKEFTITTIDRSGSYEYTFEFMRQGEDYHGVVWVPLQVSGRIQLEWGMPDDDTAELPALEAKIKELVKCFHKLSTMPW